MEAPSSVQEPVNSGNLEVSSKMNITPETPLSLLTFLGAYVQQRRTTYDNGLAPCILKSCRNITAFRPSLVLPGLYLGGVKDILPPTERVTGYDAVGKKYDTEWYRQLYDRIRANGHDGFFESKENRAESKQYANNSSEFTQLGFLLCCCAEQKNIPQEEIDISEECDGTTVASSANKTNVEKNNCIILRNNIYLKDEECFYISDACFEETVSLLYTWHFLKKRAVIVYCRAGISRSATIVCAYLWHLLQEAVSLIPKEMRTSFYAESQTHDSNHPWTLECVLAAVQLRRAVANPNPGFRLGLTEWAQNRLLK